MRRAKSFRAMLRQRHQSDAVRRMCDELKFPEKSLFGIGYWLGGAKSALIAQSSHIHYQTQLG